MVLNFVVNLIAHMTEQTKLDKEKPVYNLDIKLIDLNITLSKGQY